MHSAILTLPLALALTACSVSSMPGVLASGTPTNAVKEESSPVSGPETVMRLARTTEAAGDLAGAATLYKRAHDLDPEALEPLLALGRTLAGLGDAQGAADAFGKALHRSPDNLEARREYAFALIALDQPRTAADELRHVLTADPTDARAYNALGIALDLIGEHGAAQKQYRKGLDHAPGDASLINNLALSLAVSGDYDEAVRMLGDLVRSPVASSRSRQNLALIHGLAGRRELAAEIGRRDLDEASVQANLAQYERLRRMAERERADATLRPTGTVR